MQYLNIGKYRNIVISIALFIFFDLSVLVLNYYISFQISEDAEAVNLAGRQRMLSQRMTKSLYDMEIAGTGADAFELASNELQNARDLFDATWLAFADGGDTISAGDQRILLKKITDPDGAKALEQSRPLWFGYRERIDRVLTAGSSGDVAIDTLTGRQALLQEAINFGRDNNQQLLATMNDLTLALERGATSTANNLRLVQTVGIVLALVNFFIALFHFIKQLREGDRIADQAKKETGDILDTVNEGLFLIKPDYAIAEQRSAKLHDILQITPGQSLVFDELLKDAVAEEDAEAARGFLRLLFNPRVKEKLIGSLNPLDRVEMNFDGGSGNYTTRYLRFSFKRVMDEDRIEEILVTVNDITETVLLERKLEGERERNKQQISMLSGILHTGPGLLKEYLTSARNSCEQINSWLRKPGKESVELKKKVNAIFTEVHKLKGESSALQLEEFTGIAHEFENKLVQMRDRPTLKGQDFLPLAMDLESMIHYVESIGLLVEQLAAFSEATAGPITTDARGSWSHLYKLVDDLAQRQQKQVGLVTTGLGEQALSTEIKDTINSVCIQFIRNAVVHGIESPQLREAMNKPAKGRIDIRLTCLGDDLLELQVSDDGSGIDAEKIRKTALDRGLYTEAGLARMDNKELTSLIFTPGFSTESAVGTDAGRGVGMDVVLKKVKQHHGKIKISSRNNQFSRFTVLLPLTLTAGESVAA